MLSQYQFVWWGLFDSTSWWPPVQFRRTHCRSPYAWMLDIGPLEIRRWKRGGW